MNRRVVVVLVVVVITLATIMSVWWWTKPTSADARSGSRRVAVVDVSEVMRRAMPVTLDAVGTVEAERAVEVRAQVNGVLERVAFSEGQLVRRGDLLFEIDPGPFRAALEQAQAALARARAQAENARAQLERLTPLVEKDYITRGEYDQARAEAAAAAATVAADEAALAKANIDLGYTQIHAPIGGRTGSLALNPGNLVSMNTPLVTINQIRPILIRFTIPQQQFETVRRYHRRGKVAVEVRSEAHPGHLLDRGELVFVDNSVNANTGTVLLKARVANTAEALLPGQFVNVRMILAIEPDRVVVPEAAIQTGQQGPFVYLLKDGKAHMQPIAIERQIEGDVVIGDGLKGGERLIIRFPRDLVPGAAVTAAKAKPDVGGARTDVRRGDAKP